METKFPRAFCGTLPKLVVLGVDFEIRLRVVANGTHLGSFFAVVNVPAIRAFPNDLFSLGKDLAVLDILEKLAVAFLVLALNLADFFEKERDFVEALFSCLLGKGCIHIGPLVMLARGGIGKILERGRHRRAKA